jgi:hypothetical protein
LFQGKVISQAEADTHGTEAGGRNLGVAERNFVHHFFVLKNWGFGEASVYYGNEKK